MLTFMRKHARSWFIKVLLGSVIVVFIFFYGFSLRQQASTLIASVNGNKIGVRAFQEQYQRLLKAQQAQSGDFSPEQIRALKETTLELMINQVLLLDQAKLWHLTISEAELSEYIQNIPAFQKDGQFVLSRFQNYLKFEGQTEEGFTEELRQSLLIQKTEDFIRDSAKITEEEVDSLYRLFNDRIVLEYVDFGPQSYLESIELSPESVREYFAAHRSEYEIPETVEVEYLRLDPETYRPEVQVSQQELEERYQSNLDRWKVSKQVLARDILLRTMEDEDPKARMQVLQKAESILTRLKEGEDFDKLAKEFSEDPETASEGGSLGWKRRGELPESLDKALFEEMSPGQLCDRPIKSPEGFHILRLDEVQSESIRPLDEVKETLAGEIKKEKSHERASELADKAYMTIFQGATFEEAARELNIPLQKSPLFSLDGSVGGLSVGPLFRETAFALKDNEDFSEVIEEGGAFFILHLLEKHPSREPELAEVEEKVRGDLREVRALERAKEEANDFIKNLSEGENAFSAFAEQRGYKVLTSPPFGRFYQQGGLPQDLIQKAFSLPPEEALIKESFPHGNQFVVARIKERIAADTDGMEQQKKAFRSMMLQQRRESTYQEWLEMARSRSEIKTHKAYEDLL